MGWEIFPQGLTDVLVRIDLQVDSDFVMIDNIWAWCADHGVPGSFGWVVKTGRNGLIIDGDDVTATGLFVEHYQQYNVIWNGENGRTVLFQHELPYDPPNQAAWPHDGILGWAASPTGCGRTSCGAAVIHVHQRRPDDPRGARFEVPVKPGVVLRHIMTRFTVEAQGPPSDARERGFQVPHGH